MDIVYTVKDCLSCEELTYSLRSLANLPHDRVFIVGGCPKNINTDKVVFIPTLQNFSRYVNTMNSLGTVCRNKELSEKFILMNDDFFILKPITDPEQELNLCGGTIESCVKKIRERNGVETFYSMSMHQTDVYLKDIGIKTPLSYELHIPMVLEKTKLLKLFSLPYLTNSVLPHKRSLYGNLYLRESTEIEDVKVYGNYVPPPNDKFLSTEDNTWSQVKPQLEKLFPNKSIYEI